MKNRLRIIVLCLLMVCASGAWAYKQSTHAVITEYSAERSVINDPSSGVLSSLNLGNSVGDRNFLLPATFSPFGFQLRTTPEQLIIQGVRDEDEGRRSLNHFFDPQQNGQTIPVPFVQHYPSPGWALEDPGQIDGQSFSYQDAKNYLRNSALTSSSKEERDRNLGLLFESLGHVTHHLQDMSQPQHVRNDDHCDDTAPIFILFGFTIIESACQQLNRYRPSAYEEYVANLGRALPLGGYPTPDYTTFSTPREFWEDSGKGNAEFTSNNFVSVRTNFRLDTESVPPAIRSESVHPLPWGSDASLTDRNINDLDMLGPLSPTQPLAGDISFVQTPIQDNYDSAYSVPNPRTSTLSIFYHDLVIEHGPSISVPAYAFTLNRLNYEAAAQRLVPRAAAYSVGMLNYFFRGRIEISLPSNGVYSVVDHAVTNAVGQGFTKFKVNLRNATPDAAPPGGSPFPLHQEMSQGTLIAIAKYYPNPCYTPDLRGEFDGVDFVDPITRSGCTFLDYLLSAEEIAVSKEMPGVSLDRNNPAEFTFDFGDKPIPINARDLSIQIVYQGVLGAEREAVVVSGSNISEPTYMAVLNMSDYYSINGRLYTPQQVRDDTSTPCNLLCQAHGDNIDPEPLENVQLSVGDVPITGIGTIQPKDYIRLAALTDAEIKPPALAPRIPLKVANQFPNRSARLSNLSTNPIQNQLAREPRILSAIFDFRGITTWRMLIVFKSSDGVNLVPTAFDSLLPVDPNCFTPACSPLPASIPIVFP